MHSLAGVQNQGGSQGWCLLRGVRYAFVRDFPLWLVDDHLLYLFMSSSLYVCLSLCLIFKITQSHWIRGHPTLV